MQLKRFVFNRDVRFSAILDENAVKVITKRLASHYLSFDFGKEYAVHQKLRIILFSDKSVFFDFQEYGSKYKGKLSKIKKYDFGCC